MNTGGKRAASLRTGQARPSEENRVQRQIVPTLSKREIEERIGRVMSEIAALAGCDVEAQGSDTRPCHPVWIAPSDLVARMRRFLVYN